MITRIKSEVSNNKIVDKINIDKKKMNVSMAVLPTLTGEAAKNVLDALDNPTIDKEYLDRCEMLVSSIRKGKSKK